MVANTNLILRGEGLFEITDHTTASDWERFTSSLEETLTEWKLNKQTDASITYKELPRGFISSGLWREKHDTLRLGNCTFDIRYQYLEDGLLKEISKGDETKITPTNESDDNESLEFQLARNEEYQFGEVPIEEEREHEEHELPDEIPECLRDLIATTNDFASKAHCLVRWYNLRKFIILVPRGDTIVSEVGVKLILSSASISLANIDCHIPLFVQIHNLKNNFYQGISEHFNIRTMYEMIFLNQNLKQYSYMSELISLFREKTSCNLNDPIFAAIRLNYCLDFFELFLDSCDEFEANEHSDEEEGKDELVRMTENKRKLSKMRAQDMRSGATFEQVKESLKDCLPHPFKILKFIHVAALWPDVSDKVVNDSQVHSDLDPAEAPIWTIRCVTGDNCNMKIVHETQAINNLLQAAIKFAYDKSDASQIFNNCDKEVLEADCLELSYKLATQPEVILSQSPSDNIRKIIALLFFRAKQLSASDDDHDNALDHITGHLKKQPSLSEIYRNFKTINQPSVKEFILRTQVSRPFHPVSTPALPQRMFCTVCDNEFRLCGAFSELCN